MFTQLTVLLLAGLAGPLLSAGPRNRIPVVAGELVAGIVVGRSALHLVDATAQPAATLYSLGFAMLMLTAGTHVDIASPALHRGARRGLLAFAGAGVAAAALGPLVSLAFSAGHPALFAVLLAGSSAAVAFPIIEEFGLTGDTVAFLIAWFAVADSATVLVMPLTLGSGNVAGALGGDALVVIAGVGAYLALRPLVPRREAADAIRRSIARGWGLQLRLSILLLLGLSTIADLTGGSLLVAGFLTGMILVRLHESRRLTIQLSGVANGFFIPLFFVLLGARLDFGALFTSPAALGVALAMGAGSVAVHLAGAALAARTDRLPSGMTASAQLGLPAAAASIGLSTHTLAPAIAAALVGGALLTLIPATLGALRLAKETPAAAPA